MFMLAVLALLIFGPERLPGIARSVGQTIGRIRREATSTFDALREESELSELREFSSELQRERDELTSIARVDGKDSASRRARPKRPPRYDPQST
jgi:sec-independent protein translocase protein TatB